MLLRSKSSEATVKRIKSANTSWFSSYTVNRCENANSENKQSGSWMIMTNGLQTQGQMSSVKVKKFRKKKRGSKLNIMFKLSAYFHGQEERCQDGEGFLSWKVRNAETLRQSKETCADEGASRCSAERTVFKNRRSFKTLSASWAGPDMWTNFTNFWNYFFMSLECRVLSLHKRLAGRCWLHLETW